MPRTRRAPSDDIKSSPAARGMAPNAKVNCGQGTQIRGDDHAFLRSLTPTHALESSNGSALRAVDLFCGAGGLSLGVAEAAASLGYRHHVALACDTDQSALACFAENFPGVNALPDDISKALSPDFDAALTPEERKLRKLAGDVDLLVGGPPCQGHSDLNNYSRRNDPKNSLYYCMARAVRVFEPQAVLIENVLGAAHDTNRVVDTVHESLATAGFNTTQGIMDCLPLGIPQKRRRLILLGSEGELPSVGDIQAKYSVPLRDLRWAISDIEHEETDSVFTASSRPKPTTQDRIDYLFDNGLYELPNSQRPPCHQHGNHTYNSVYGRLRWDQPAQTITGGFYCMCMGRYVHPSQRRTLTAHEAARIQFFPDYFDFSPCTKRTPLATLIGNAVPPKVGYALAREIMLLTSCTGQETATHGDAAQ